MRVGRSRRTIFRSTRICFLRAAAGSPQTLEQLQKLESQLRERDEKLSELLSGKKALDDELQRLRIEVAEAKKQNAARARRSQLFGSGNPRLLHRFVAERSGLGARQSTRPGISRYRHAQQHGRRICRLRAVGRRRQTAWARRSKADETRLAGRSTASEAVRRLPGETVWPAAGNFLLQRLRPLDVGRAELSAAAGTRFLQKTGVGTSHSKTHGSQGSSRCQNRRVDCRTLLSIAGDTARG